MRGRMRTDFLTGLVAILPIVLTVLVIWFLVTKLGNLLGTVFERVPYLDRLPSPAISVLGLLAILFLIYFIGVLARIFRRRWLLRFVERIISRVPLVRTIYTSAQKFSQTIFLDRSAFRRVVLVEYPRKGVYTLAFVTSEAKWDITGGRRAVNLFVPTTPNPTSGYYLIVPEEDLIPTTLTIEEGFKTVISGGIVLPKTRRIDAETSEVKKVAPTPDRA